jgi:hypothetical protein
LFSAGALFAITAGVRACGLAHRTGGHTLAVERRTALLAGANVRPVSLDVLTICPDVRPVARCRADHWLHLDECIKTPWENSDGCFGQTDQEISLRRNMALAGCQSALLRNAQSLAHRPR